MDVKITLKNVKRCKSDKLSFESIDLHALEASWFTRASWKHRSRAAAMQEEVGIHL